MPKQSAPKQKTYTTYQGWKGAVKRIWGSYGRLDFGVFYEAEFYDFASLVTHKGLQLGPVALWHGDKPTAGYGTIETPDA